LLYDDIGPGRAIIAPHSRVFCVEIVDRQQAATSGGEQTTQRPAQLYFINILTTSSGFLVRLSGHPSIHHRTSVPSFHADS